MNSLATQWTAFRSQFPEHAAQLRLALRVTIAALFSFAFSRWLKVPLPLWTVVTAVVLTQATFGKSVKATIDYLVGTLGGAVYAGAVAILVPHSNDVSLAGVLALAVAPLAFLGGVYPSLSVAPLTGVLVLLVPRFIPVGPIESAVDRVLEVAVGGIIALAVSLLVLPVRAHALVIEGAARTLDLMGGSIPELFEGFIRPRDAAAVARIQDRIGEALARTQASAAEAKHERIVFLAAEPDHGPLMRTLKRLRHDLVMIGQAAAEPLPESLQARLGPLLAEVARASADQLRRRGQALAGRREPTSLEGVEAAFDHYAEAIASIGCEGLTQGLPVDALERIFTLGFALDQMRQDFRDLERCASEIARSR